MFKITIKNLLSKTIVWDGKATNLLMFLLDHIDVMHACGGKGRCTTCKMRIVNSDEPLPADSPAEARFRSLGRLHADERLSCQIRPNAHLVLEVPESSKLPHLSYIY